MALKKAKITRHALKRGTHQPEPVQLDEVGTTWDHENGHRVFGYDRNDGHRRWSVQLDDATERYNRMAAVGKS